MFSAANFSSGSRCTMLWALRRNREELKLRSTQKRLRFTRKLLRCAGSVLDLQERTIRVKVNRIYRRTVKDDQGFRFCLNKTASVTASAWAGVVNNACCALIADWPRMEVNSWGDKHRTVWQNALLPSSSAFHQIFNASSKGSTGRSTICPDTLESALAQARENDISTAYSCVCHFVRYSRRPWPRRKHENVTLKQ
jgi:hypothetical protein